MTPTERPKRILDGKYLSKLALVWAPPLRVLYDRYTLWKSRTRMHAQFVDKDAKTIFSEIYEGNLWGSEGTVSGSGSELETTEEIRLQLPEILKSFNIESILDIPCGDFAWMKECIRGVKQYIGADIVPALVDHNTKNYPADNIQFQKLDLLVDDLPTVDLIFCRDCLIHFSFDDVFRTLSNIVASNSKYLMTTHYLYRPHNKAMITGDFRQINLCAPPFDLPEPIHFVLDRHHPANPSKRDYDRGMGLWKISDIAPLIAT